MVANRDEVRRVTAYHANVQEQLRGDLAVPAAKRGKLNFRMEGIQPAQFESTAWQLAQATQALVDIDSDLSFALARIYGVQAPYQGLSEGITDAMYLRPPSEDLMALLHSLSRFYGDIVVLERRSCTKKCCRNSTASSLAKSAR